MAAPTVDAIATCRGYIGDAGPDSLIMRIPVVINSISAELTSSQLTEMLSINFELEELIAIAPPSLSTHLRTTQLPFKQVADAVSTGGNLTLTTGGIRDAALPLLTACNEAGYRVDD